MGYILPIHHDQYKHYANRLSRTDRSPFIIEPISAKTIKPKKNFEQTNEYLFKRIKGGHEEDLRSYDGKGQVIDEFI